MAGMDRAASQCDPRESPRRRQPTASWLAAGSSVSVALWFLFTWLLSLYLTKSASFGQTYGPLAGMIGLLLWALLTSLAIYLGIAFATQLEAIRAGAPGPVTGEQQNPAGSGPNGRRSTLSVVVVRLILTNSSPRSSSRTHSSSSPYRARSP